MLSTFATIPLLVSLVVPAMGLIQDRDGSVLESQVSSSQGSIVAQNSCSDANQAGTECSAETAEVIRLVKQTAASLSSPPRIYASAGERTSLWPGQPGTYLTEDDACAMHSSSMSSCALSLALITSVESGNDGDYQVMLQSTWSESGQSQSHAWMFHVGKDRQVTFMGEAGDRLPPMPM